MSIQRIKRIKDFIKVNGEKGMTLMAYIYAAYYRFCVLHIPKQKLEQKMGVRGEESIAEETEEHLKQARLIAFHVNRITTHTPWESKCLVRALTVQRLLKQRGITSTLYLGVGKENDKMVAHAWLRCGLIYLTGGNGRDYATVTKFRT